MTRLRRGTFAVEGELVHVLAAWPGGFVLIAYPTARAIAWEFRIRAGGRCFMLSRWRNDSDPIGMMMVLLRNERRNVQRLRGWRRATGMSTKRLENGTRRQIEMFGQQVFWMPVDRIQYPVGEVA